MKTKTTADHAADLAAVRALLTTMGAEGALLAIAKCLRDDAVAMPQGQANAVRAIAGTVSSAASDLAHVEYMAGVRPAAFKPLEVTSRRPGKDWVLRIVKTQGAADKLFASLTEACAEVRVRDAK